jgi:uncharacterized protein
MTPLTCIVYDAQSASPFLVAPPDPLACYVIAHGAGAGVNHTLMAAVVDDLRHAR